MKIIHLVLISFNDLINDIFYTFLLQIFFYKFNVIHVYKYLISYSKLRKSILIIDEDIIIFQVIILKFHKYKYLYKNFNFYFSLF